jgi:hypothetical protein
MKTFFFFLLSVSIFLFSCNPDITCGFDDGPFHSTLISIPLDSIIENKYISCDENSTLYYDNRNTNSCPIITLIENDSIIFSLEMNLSNNDSGTNWELHEISNLEIKRNTKNTLKLTFWCYWTFGHEWGTMKIDKKTGENNFCLSW